MIQVRALCAAVVALLLIGSVRAQPVNGPEWLPEHTRWVVQIDVRAARESPCCNVFFADDAAPTRLTRHLEAFQAHTGIDPLRDFEYVTLFGAEYQSRDAVAVIIAHPRVDDAIETFREQHAESIQILQFGQNQVQEAERDQARQYLHVRSIRNGDARLLVYSEAAEQLHAALDAMDRATDLSFESAVPEGVIMRAEASDLQAIVQKHAASSSGRSIDRLELVFGAELGSRMFVHLDVLAGSEEAASRLARMAAGTAAWATSLARQASHGAARKLQAATTIGSTDERVSVRISLVEPDVHEVMRAVSAGLRRSSVAGRK